MVAYRGVHTLQVRVALVLGAGVLATVAVLLVGVPGLSYTENGEVDQRTASFYTPKLAAYADVPLPVGEPPPGAFVRATGYADTAKSGEQISFEYPGFTVSACSIDVRTADDYACAQQPGAQLIRRAQSGSRVTSYVVSTKFDSALAGSPPDRTVSFFKTAPLAPRPEWMKRYVNREIKELFGS